MKKIWKIMILCMIFCFFCAGCSNDDEMISEDHPKPTTEKRTEIIKQKTTQKKNEVTVDQEQSKQQEDRIKIAIDAGHQKKQMSEKEDKTDGILRNRRYCHKTNRISGEFGSFVKAKKCIDRERI